MTYYDRSYNNNERTQKHTCSHCSGYGTCGGANGYSCATCRAEVERRTGEKLVPADRVMCASCNGKGYHLDNEY